MAKTEAGLTITGMGSLKRPATITWEEVMAAWLDATTSSQQTRDAYKRSVCEMFEYIGVDLLHQVNARMLAAYRAWLVGLMEGEEEERLAPATVALRLSAARSFCTFASMVGVLSLSKDVIRMALASFRYETVKPYNVLSEQEEGMLLAWARANRPERDALMIEVMLVLGLRVSEVVSAREEHLTRDDEGDWILRVVQGKGRKDRLLPVPAALADRVVNREERDQDWLFVSRQGEGRLSSRRVQQIVGECVAGAGIDRSISPHSLRHTCAIRWLRAGVNPSVVQKLLGHASLRTTQRYLDHIQMQELKDAVQDIAPGEVPRSSKELEAR